MSEDDASNRFPLVTAAILVGILATAHFVTGWIPTMESIEPVAFSSDTWQDRPETLLYSIFAHGGPIHLFMNAMALLSFGPFVERGLGPARYAILYLFAGLLGNLAHAAFQPGVPAVGASGAIFGLMGVLVVLAPTMSVLILNLVPMPILILGALYAILVPYLTSFNHVVPIAHEAHVGGMVAGILFALLLNPLWALKVAPAAALVFLSLSFLVADLVRNDFDLARVPPYLALALVIGAYAYLRWIETKRAGTARAVRD